MASLALSGSFSLAFPLKSRPLLLPRSSSSLKFLKPLPSVHSRISYVKSPVSLPLTRRSSIVRASSAASPSPSVVPAPVPWQGAAIKPLLASIATGLILWFVPVPDGVSRNAWQLLAIFLATIVGIITQPLPLGAVALLGLGASVTENWS